MKGSGSMIYGKNGKVFILVAFFCSELGSARRPAQSPTKRSLHSDRVEEDYNRDSSSSALSQLSHSFKRGGVRPFGSDDKTSQGFYGFLGCKLDKAICQHDEQCVDDDLFGSCQKSKSGIDRYQYRLLSTQEHQLEQILSRLIREDYTWSDLYTQCVVGNALLAFQLQQDYDPLYCDDGSIPRRENPTGENPAKNKKSGSILRGQKDNVENKHQRMISGDEEENSLFPLVSDKQLNADDILNAGSMQHVNRWKKENDFVSIHKYKKERERRLEKSFPDYSHHERSQARYKSSERQAVSPETLHQSDTGRPETLRESDTSTVLEYLKTLRPEEIAELEALLEEQGELEEWNEPNVEFHENKALQDAVKPEGPDEHQQLSRSDYLTDETADDDVISPNVNPLHDYLDTESHLAPAFKGLRMSEVSAPALKLVDVSEDSASAPEVARVVMQDTHPGSGEHFMDVQFAPGYQMVNPGGEDAFSQSLSNQMTDKRYLNVIKDIVDENKITTTTTTTVSTQRPRYDVVDTRYAYLLVQPRMTDVAAARSVVSELENMLQLSHGSFSDLSIYNGDINFRVNLNSAGLNSSIIAASAMGLADELHNRTGYLITDAGVGHVTDAYADLKEVSAVRSQYFLLLLILSGGIACILLVVIVCYFLRRHLKLKEKQSQFSEQKVNPGTQDVSKDYQELCRQHMFSKISDKPEPIHLVGRIGSVSALETAAQHSPSSRSSTSSWSEEPVAATMDILTGHMVLSYMEDQLKMKDRLDNEWDALKSYEPEQIAVNVAALPANKLKNRYMDVLPYDHSRVVLHSSVNEHGSDYINATMITDHDPRSPAYVVTQGPLPNTVPDFWQMVWEQGSVVIVNLTKLVEHGSPVCHCYWPSEGSTLYHIYEVHLISEHIWCEDYLIRSFYLKNLQTNETRTVTQFHFTSWPDLGVPSSSKALLDFRRKVNKSFRGRSCPIVVHCSDGAGRSGTYCLIDMVLNRIIKGAKEIDIAATLEHIRDQRMLMVKTKEQFQFVLVTVAEEVHAVLKALPQT